ncbi:hypothetical protein [Dechloromonas denitrificans]|uniref:hypothetical protein n=1 Tax=Dechloromonas denitrificans TaxID=281362 RepID=UPI001CF8F8A4|nr:hypothetical protein [Dechloromonas denitrificans]UCV03305.1 hypothetical protein KI611_19920 [Dechloromonas denitrificans]
MTLKADVKPTPANRPLRPLGCLPSYVSNVAGCSLWQYRLVLNAKRKRPIGPRFTAAGGGRDDSVESSKAVLTASKTTHSILLPTLTHFSFAATWLNTGLVIGDVFCVFATAP